MNVGVARFQNETVFPFSIKMNLYLRIYILIVFGFHVVVCANNSIIYDSYLQTDSNDITTIVTESKINNSFDSNESNVHLGVPRNCTTALESFTEHATNLTRCIIINARPIHLCMNCDRHFKATVETFTYLQEEPSPCHKFYFESDQIGIIQQVFTQGRDFWTKNNCQNCQDFINDTIEFFELSERFEECIKEFNGSSEQDHNNTCDMCQELFVKINNIYREFVKRMSKDDSEGVCMDIVDTMNITRHMWSRQNCLRFDTYVGYPNIITAVLVGAMPIFFYMLSKNISIIEDVKLVRPKRKSYASLIEYAPSE